MMQESFSFTALLHSDIIYKIKRQKSKNTTDIQGMSKIKLVMNIVGTFKRLIYEHSSEQTR